ncbi:hypothetical protein P278_09490 [Zhouia amylolytica AD3]|uniref:Uncharacterized protein n=1 Tax=Zhouia amylolytica AD3 TaxID=1286632 RepID=W2UQ70_9FLAO|nr:hypothetical protein P278_09490 [Zhouia amylolytica AD3]
MKIAGKYKIIFMLMVPEKKDYTNRIIVNRESLFYLGSELAIVFLA